MLDLKWIIVDEVQDSDEKQLKFLEALKGTQTHFLRWGSESGDLQLERNRTEYVLPDQAQIWRKRTDSAG